MIAMSTMKARALLVAVVLALVAFDSPAQASGSCGGQVHQNSCGNATNIYPCCPNGGNCTWWAWENICRNWHVSLPNWGNANTWAAHAHVDPRFDVLGSPVVPSVGTATPRSGHVAWVLGTGGGAVTVTEENCCVGCAGGIRTVSYPVSKFNSGYVALHGETAAVVCECSPGQTDNEACSCGAHARTCGADCKWGAFSACAGPPEICDGIDNDCNGLIDDGYPQTLGTTRPDYAATLVDTSSPHSLDVGEHATAWGDFRNDGNLTWSKGQIWLAAKGDTDAGVSGLYSQGQWPAYDVAATLDHDVAPNEVARFTFDVTSDAKVSAQLDDSFALRTAAGAFLACPSPVMTTSIWVGPGAAANAAGAGEDAGADAGASDPSPARTSGCAATPSSASGGASGVLLAAVVVGFIGRLRRRNQRAKERAS